jgi:hypothetical protein
MTNVSRPVEHSDELMTVRITKISEISAILTGPRRVLDRGPTIRDTSLVPRLGLRRIFHLKADGTAVKDSCRLAIDGFGHHEPAAIVGVCQSASRILNTRARTHRCKQRIIEFLNFFDRAVSLLPIMMWLNILFSPPQANCTPPC